MDTASETNSCDSSLLNLKTTKKIEPHSNITTHTSKNVYSILNGTEISTRSSFPNFSSLLATKLNSQISEDKTKKKKLSLPVSWQIFLTSDEESSSSEDSTDVQLEGIKQVSYFLF